MLQNVTSLRKSAPGPPNSSDEHVSCTAPATSLQILLTRCTIPCPCACHAKRHLNVQKRSEHVVLFSFWPGNVLRATTPCTCSTSERPKVARTCGALDILTSKCASRDNAVHLFDIATSKSSPKLRCFCTFWLGNVLRATTACNFSSLIWPGGSAPARFSKPTFQPSGATNHSKNTMLRDVPTWIFFLLRLSLFWSSFIFSSLLWLFPPVLFHLSILSEVWLLNILRWDLYAVRSLSCEILFAVRCDIHRMTSIAVISIYNGIHCIAVASIALTSIAVTSIAVTSIFLWLYTSSTAQGGGGSFKNRKPIGEVGCCESRMAERSHWWTDQVVEVSSLSLSFCLFLWLSTYLPTYLSMYPSLSLSVYLSIHLSMYLSIYLSLSLSACLSIYICLSASLKTKLFCETSSIFEVGNMKNEAILRDFLNFWTWQHEKRSNSARLLPKMESCVQRWWPRTNEFCDFSTPPVLKYCPCHEKAMPGHRKCCTAAPVTQNHLSKPEDLRLQNATPLRKSAPGPPNSSDEHVSCTAPATENASLQILFKCPSPAIVFGNATKPWRFAHFWQGAQSLAPATQNDIWTSKSGANMWCF